MLTKKTGEWDIRFNSLAGVGDHKILVSVEEEGVCVEARPRLFVHKLQRVVLELPAYPGEMVEIGVVHLLYTLTIPFLEGYVALLLIMLESQGVGPVCLALLKDLFVSEWGRAMRRRRRKEVGKVCLILHANKPFKVQEIRHQIVDKLAVGSIHSVWSLDV
jgi:hypothetical protein